MVSQIVEIKSEDVIMKQSKEEKALFQMFFIFLALLFLSSCSSYLPQAQEMGNMALLRSFGIDRGETWKVTVSTGQQRKGSTQEEPIILSGEALTLQGACREIANYTEDYVFFAYVDQLILGEELAKTGIYSAVNYFATDDQLSLGAGLWITLGEAETLISSATEEGTGEHLQTLTEESNLGIAGITRKVGEVLADLHSQGASYVPILVPTEKDVLTEGGYGIIVEDKLVTIFQGEMACGLSLLESHPQLVELTLPEGTYAVEIKEISRKICPLWSQSGELSSVEVFLDIQGKVVEEPLTPREDIGSHLEKYLANIAQSTLVSLQEEKADVLNFQGAIAFSSPIKFSQLEWDGLFSQLETKTTVKVTLD